MKILVCGSSGFIGGHLVEYLKNRGHWVRGADIRPRLFEYGAPHEFILADLRYLNDCMQAVRVDGGFDQIYQLAADMGGMGYISSAECNIMHNNALINLSMLEAAAAHFVGRYFFSSSVCVYRNMTTDEGMLTENDVYPAMPDNEYGWEKLFSERAALAYARNGMLEHVRIARFQNTYGPYCAYDGGREKAPAAICRKVAQAEDGTSIEVWGAGGAVRSYTHVSDLLQAIYLLMNSDLEGPVNIGADDFITVQQLAQTIIAVSGKDLDINWVPGPVGVQSRNFSKVRIKSLGWRTSMPFVTGMAHLYGWIRRRVEDDTG